MLEGGQYRIIDRAGATVGSAAFIAALGEPVTTTRPQRIAMGLVALVAMVVTFFALLSSTE